VAKVVRYIHPFVVLWAPGSPRLYGTPLQYIVYILYVDGIRSDNPGYAYSYDRIISNFSIVIGK
jgi:hypothetical protein